MENSMLSTLHHNSKKLFNSVLEKKTQRNIIYKKICQRIKLDIPWKPK